MKKLFLFLVLATTTPCVATMMQQTSPDVEMAIMSERTKALALAHILNTSFAFPADDCTPQEILDYWSSCLANPYGYALYLPKDAMEIDIELPEGNE